MYNVMRFGFILVLFSILFSNVVYSGCAENVFDDSCRKVSESFTTFNVNAITDDDVESFDVTLSELNNPSNTFSLNITGSQIRNLDPLINSEVYVLDIDIRKTSGRRAGAQLDFFFDDTTPKPPAIPIVDHTDEEFIFIKGFATPNSEVILSDEDSDITTYSILNDGILESSIEVDPGYNFFKFRSERGNKFSSDTNRIVLRGDYSELENNFLEIDDVVFDDLTKFNSGTFLDGIDYDTFERNFVVSGSINKVNNGESGFVYVRGRKVPVDSNGKFMVVVSLNEGENDLRISGDGFDESISVNYLINRPKLSSLNFDKVVSTDTFSIDGSLIDGGFFEVELNGEIVEFVSADSQGNFNMELIGLREGPNFFSFKGGGDLFYYDYVFLDAKIPEATLASSEVLANSREIVFRIEDDFGIDEDSIVFTLDDRTFEGDSFDVEDDFYIIELKDLEQKIYSYSLSFSDISGKNNEISGTINVDLTESVIDNIIVDGGRNVGDILLTKPGESEIVVIPSRFIAFKSIFIDNEEIVDYEIKENGNIEININFIKDSGTIDIVFVDSSLEEKSVSYRYFTDDERPEVFLNNIPKDYFQDDSIVKIVGRIDDSYFDWSSFRVNGGTNFIRLGDYFQAYVRKENLAENIIFTGLDISGNSIEENALGSILTKDDQDIDITVDFLGFGLLNFSHINSISDNNRFVSNLDGSAVLDFNVFNNEVLAMSQVEDFRNLEISGYELSSEDFSFGRIDNYFSKTPLVYFSQGVNGVVEVYIDSTALNFNENLIEIQADGQIIDDLNSCDNKGFDFCFEVSSTFSISVTIDSGFGKTYQRTFVVGEDDFDFLVGKNFPLEIFLSGTDLEYPTGLTRITGIIKSPSKLSSVEVDGVECDISDYTFVCEVLISEGLNSFNFVGTNSNLGSISETFEFVGVGSKNYVIELEDVLPENLVFKVDENFFTLSKNLNLDGTSSDSGNFVVYINDRDVYLGEFGLDFILPLNISQNVYGKNFEEIDVEVSVLDDGENDRISNTLRIIYNRVAQTIVEIVIG